MGTRKKSKHNGKIPAQEFKECGENKKILLSMIVLAVISLACFSTKAFHIDDPLFIWAAHQIQRHPLDFYGFNVNWYYTAQPMAKVTQNPPLASYYAAPVIAVFGDNEVALHLAFLIPAILLMLGTYRLAKRCCKWPLLATLVATFTPVFMVSSTTVMSDILMLCFWVWAMEFWVRGMEERKDLYLAASALAIVGCALSKYFGASLIPLFLVYSLVKQREAGRWIAYLVAAAGALWVYNWITGRMYGQGLLTDAVSYTQYCKTLFGESLAGKTLVGFSFIGGCLLPVLFFAPLLWSKRGLLIGLAGIVIFIALLGIPAIGKTAGVPQDETEGLIIIQMSVFIAAGLGIIALSIQDIKNKRDAVSLTLFLWTIGTFLFAAFFNWTINGRSVLPLAPVAAILVVRRLSARASLKKDLHAVVPLVAAAMLSLLVTWADFTLANSARTAARSMARDYATSANPVWFQGHWGFQYYMEKAGFKHIDSDTNQLKKLMKGDLLILPFNNSNVTMPAPGDADLVRKIQFNTCGFLSTMVKPCAGFYASGFGPLPYSFGPVPPESYTVASLK